MTNPYYTPSGSPATQSTGSSAIMRAEFTNIQAGFALLPTLSGNGSKAVVVDPTGAFLTTTTGSLALAGNLTTTGAFNTTLAQQASVTLTLPAVSGTLATLAGIETLTNKTLTSPAITGGTIDNAVIGSVTPAAATVTTLTATGGVTSTSDASGFGLSVRNRSGDDLGSIRFFNNAGSATQGQIRSNSNGSFDFQTGTAPPLIQVEIQHTASANRYITLTGSNGGNPQISTSGGLLGVGVAILGAGSIFAQGSTAMPAGGTTGAGFLMSNTSNFGIFFGSGAPTLSAAQGSIYLRSDGAPQYNTNGTTGWSTIGATVLGVTNGGIQTTSFNAASNTRYFAEGSGITATGPASPSQDDVLVIAVGASAVTFNPNGNKVNGQTGNITLQPYNTYVMTYGTTSGWC